MAKIKKLGSGNDVFNGDGFDDVLIGARKHQSNGVDSGAAYLIYGGPGYTAKTTFDPASATAGADKLIGGWGNDIITGISTGDSARGGAGDDQLRVSGTDFVSIDGGHGRDTLKITGSGDTFNFRSLGSRVENIETIDLLGNGQQTVILGKYDVFRLSEDTSAGITHLVIRGNGATGGSSADIVDLTGGLGTIGWSNDGTYFDLTGTFTVWTNGNAQIDIQSGVVVI